MYLYVTVIIPRDYFWTFDLFGDAGIIPNQYAAYSKSQSIDCTQYYCNIIVHGALIFYAVPHGATGCQSNTPNGVRTLDSNHKPTSNYSSIFSFHF